MKSPRTAYHSEMNLLGIKFEHVSQGLSFPFLIKKKNLEWFRAVASPLPGPPTRL